MSNPSRRPVLAPRLPLLLRLLPFLLPLAAAGLSPAAAQGHFQTNGPFTLSLNPAHGFVLEGVPIKYIPLAGKTGQPQAGYLTLSIARPGSFAHHFSGVSLAFSPTLGGTPTVTDTFPLGSVAVALGPSYSLASVGAGAGGSTFNLTGGHLASASAIPSAPAVRAATRHRPPRALLRAADRPNVGNVRLRQ